MVVVAQDVSHRLRAVRATTTCCLLDDSSDHPGHLVVKTDVLVFASRLEGVDGGLARLDCARAVLPALAGGVLDSDAPARESLPASDLS